MILPTRSSDRALAIDDTKDAVGAQRPEAPSASS
jgi:hypothetical protein